MVTSLANAVDSLRAHAERFKGRATIVGKGPSFARFAAERDRCNRFVVGLNEVSLRVPCDAAFVIDADILRRHDEALLSGGPPMIIVPRVPHLPRSVGGFSVYAPAEHGEDRWSNRLGSKLARFNLGTSEAAADLGEPVPPYSFSAPCAAHLLALAGFRDIQLAGIDGGARYSADFKDFEYKKLRSLQNSFDHQFDDLRQVRDRFGVQFSSVRCEAPFVLIGAEPEQCLATEVLKWSIEAHTFLTVRYVEATHVARELYAEHAAGTPFSFQRVYLPAMAGHHGRGVYFDSDMLVMRDVFELFNWDMGDNVLLGCEATPGRQAQYSVFLVDNAKAAWNPDVLLRDYREGKLSYEQIIGQFSFAEPRASTLPMQWNALEHYEPGRTCNLHFTDMGTQPWLSIYNPAADLWCESLAAALKARPAVREALDRSLSQGWVRPSLRWQVDNDHHNPWTLPAAAKRLDRNWLPPHALARPSSASRGIQLLRWRVSSRIRRAMQSRSYRRFVLARIALGKVFVPGR